MKMNFNFELGDIVRFPHDTTCALFVVAGRRTTSISPVYELQRLPDRTYSLSCVSEFEIVLFKADDVLDKVGFAIDVLKAASLGKYNGDAVNGALLVLMGEKDYVQWLRR